MCRLEIVAVLVVLASPMVAGTQPAPRRSARVPDGTVGAELSVLEPRGNFRPGNSISIGYGLSGALRWGPARAFDIGVSYRSVTHDSRTYSDTLKVNNMLRTLALTTRYMLPLGPARPYIGASVGAAYFGTETFVERCCDDDGDEEWTFSNIRLGQLAPMAATRVGLALDLWKMAGANPSTVALDLGVETHYGREASYQVGGLGAVRRSGTGYRVYALGISVRTR